MRERLLVFVVWAQRTRKAFESIWGRREIKLLSSISHSLLAASPTACRKACPVNKGCLYYDTCAAYTCAAHLRRTCAMNVYTMIHVRRTPVRRTCTAYMYHSVNTLLKWRRCGNDVSHQSGSEVNSQPHVAELYGCSFLHVTFEWPPLYLGARAEAAKVQPKNV